MSNVFNWQDYLAFAQELKLEADKNDATFAEAKYRSVISRAYYAVFHLAEDRFKHDYPTVPVRTHSSHEFIINENGKSKDYNRREISIKLERVRGWRIKGDYHATLPDLENAVKKALRLADEIVVLLANLSSP
jgi:uncharacterized protein (UPF0332 family)